MNEKCKGPPSSEFDALVEITTKRGRADGGEERDNKNLRVLPLYEQTGSTSKHTEPIRTSQKQNNIDKERSCVVVKYKRVRTKAALAGASAHTREHSPPEGGFVHPFEQVAKTQRKGRQVEAIRLKETTVRYVLRASQMRLFHSEPASCCRKSARPNPI